MFGVWYVGWALVSDRMHVEGLRSHRVHFKRHFLPLHVDGSIILTQPSFASLGARFVSIRSVLGSVAWVLRELDEIGIDLELFDSFCAFARD